MRSKSVKPSHYPPIPFHTIRTVSFLCSIITVIILVVFIYNLQQANHKLPWAFLVLLIASVLSLCNIFLTTVIHCCYGLSPRFSLTLNTLLLILWGISLGLFSWSVSHTILTTCNTTYWGNSTGINVCRSFKALFAFTIIAFASSIAAIWLDIIVRRRQTALGVYGQMGSNPALGDVKLEDRNSAVMAHGHGHGHSPSLVSGGNNPYREDLGGNNPYHREDDEIFNVPHPIYARDGYPPEYWGGRRDSLDGELVGEPRYYGENTRYYPDEQPPAPAWMSAPRARYGGYSHPPEQTGYDPGAYR